MLKIAAEDNIFSTGIQQKIFEKAFHAANVSVIGGGFFAQAFQIFPGGKLLIAFLKKRRRCLQDVVITDQITRDRQDSLGHGVMQCYS